MTKTTGVYNGFAMSAVERAMPLGLCSISNLKRHRSYNDIHQVGWVYSMIVIIPKRPTVMINKPGRVYQ